MFLFVNIKLLGLDTRAKHTKTDVDSHRLTKTHNDSHELTKTHTDSHWYLRVDNRGRGGSINWVSSNFF